MTPLAATWGRDAQVLKRQLKLYYTNLSRSQVKRLGRAFLILHGEDGPMEQWADTMISAFLLSGRKSQLLFDEHETQIPGHPQQVAAAIGSMTR